MAWNVANLDLFHHLFLGNLSVSDQRIYFNNGISRHKKAMFRKIPYITDHITKDIGLVRGVQKEFSKISTPSFNVD